MDPPELTCSSCFPVYSRFYHFRPNRLFSTLPPFLLIRIASGLPPHYHAWSSSTEEEIETDEKVKENRLRMTIASRDSLHLESFFRSLTSVDRFAAETFHDLHEEVMATATRGHGLMVRVQQLEADFPTIEEALLLQTNHSSFFSNSGCNRIFGTTSSCRSICAGKCS